MMLTFVSVMLSIQQNCPDGQWGMGYYSGSGAYASNGLNFWKPATIEQGGANYCLYLRNDGKVGIGTNNTYGYKLAVNGSAYCAGPMVIAPTSTTGTEFTVNGDTYCLGNVGINTTNTQGYQLAVNGNIICTELKVKLYAHWPDYVLNHDYKIAPSERCRVVY